MALAARVWLARPTNVRGVVKWRRKRSILPSRPNVCGAAEGYDCRLGHVCGQYRLARCQVGDGARQLKDAVPFGFQPCGVVVYWAANLVEDILQLG